MRRARRSPRRRYPLLRLLDERTSSAALASLTGGDGDAHTGRRGDGPGHGWSAASASRRHRWGCGRAVPAEAAGIDTERGGSAEEGGGSSVAASDGGRAEHVDVLVKLIRLIAHLAISPAYGIAIATSASSLALLYAGVDGGAGGAAAEHLGSDESHLLSRCESHLLRAHEPLCAALVPVLCS